MKTKITLLVVFFTVFFNGFAQVQLDSSFGIGGRVTTMFPQNLIYGVDSAIQADGKIVVCGQFYAGVIIGLFENYQNYHCAIVRYNTDGTLDNTFGTNGIAIITSQGSASGAMSVTIQPDQKILLTTRGHRTPMSSVYHSVLRINTNGTLDTTFQTIGFDTANVTGNTGSIGVNIDSNGKILICGRDSNADFRIKRYNITGSIDTNFGINGTTNVNIEGNDFATDLAFQSDGKIVVIGQTNAASLSSFYKIGITRLSSNGILDTSFGTNGKSSFDFETTLFNPKLLITNDDKLIIGATIKIGTQNNKIGLLKTDANGNLDLSFGVNGKFILQNILQSGFSDFKIQTDNKILLVGSISNADFFMSRFDVNGNLDTTFNTTGSISTDFNQNVDMARAINIQSDGKVVVCGYSYLNNIPSSLAMARYVLGPLNTKSFDNNKFSVYPNPFSDSINLDFDNSENDILAIDLIDINGRKIEDLLKNSNIVKGNNKLHIDLLTLSKGIYFINIIGKTNSKTIKIVK